MISLAILCKAVLPWTFWYWMFGAVSDEGIKADLNAMKDVGIEGFYLMPIKDVSQGEQYNGTARQLSPEWWKRVKTVYQTADSLNLQMGIHFSDGFALAGGPWITEEESMQKVVTNIYSCSEKQAYGNIANFVFKDKFPDQNIKYTTSVEFPYSSKTPCEIIFTYDKPYIVRSLKVMTGGNNIQAHRWKIYASNDGISYKFVRSIEPARRGWQDTDAQSTYSLPETTAKYFKFCWTPEGSDPGSEDLDAAKWKPVLKVANLILSSHPVIDNYEGKTGLVWRVAKEVNYNTPDCYYQLDDFKILGNGEQLSTLNSQLSTLNVSHHSTGHKNETGGGGKGLECDKFSRKAIDKQFNNWFATIYNSVPKDMAQRVLTRLHVDSWECGCQNWSDNFPTEFKQRRGYDLMPWLPLFAGIPMVSQEQSEKVLRDVRLTIAELINDVFFDEVEKLARQYGVKLSCECVSPTMVSDGMLHYQHANYPMGEFWLNSPTHDKPNDMLDAISGAHIYGKNIVQAEGFTEVRGTWNETPAMLKPLLDRNFCLGINCMVYHVNTHNPWLDRQPGMTLDGIGTFFQRDNTWWREMKAFNSYVGESQALLQTGNPVVDIAVYTGDEVPRRAILPERLISSLPGLFGKKFIKQEETRLANIGLPMEVSPVGVNHTANMTKADMFTNPLHGYKYDSFNHNALKDAKVENGELITKGGMHYKVLVIPQAHKLNPNNINFAKPEIESLKAQGLKVIETPWNESDLSRLNIERDAVLPEGIDFCHRKTEKEDIYFLSNLTDSIISFVPSFRSDYEQMYLFAADKGKKYFYSGKITLQPYHSVFCILSNNLPDDLQKQVISCEELQTIDKIWTVSFEKTGKTIKSDSLFDWTASDDNTIKYYSGHATYTTEFKVHSLKFKDNRYTLELGNVCDIASIYVNDIYCGTAWLSPYSIDITDALKKGKNTLRIDVVNTWANALLGSDNGTPPFENIWTNGKYRMAEKKLLPAGLLGPVKLILNKTK